jgi:hypothetical protein
VLKEEDEEGGRVVNERRSLALFPELKLFHFLFNFFFHLFLNILLKIIIYVLQSFLCFMIYADKYKNVQVLFSIFFIKFVRLLNCFFFINLAIIY